MQALDYCREKAQTSQSSFLTSFRFLSAPQRDAMTILYAYCRELDDIVDDSRDANVARTTLAWWRQDLAKAFQANATPEHPVNQDATLQYAETLGLALQLTNIIRDVGEDARMGRIYLPQDELAQFNVNENSILSATPTPEFAALMQFQFNRARETYRQAVAMLPAADKKAQKAGLIMASIYYALLLEIERDGLANVLRYKIRIPNPRKVRIALKTWLLGFKP